jgi:hypothetical protein
MGCINDFHRRTSNASRHCISSSKRTLWCALSHPLLTVDRVKNADFERAMKLVTTRIDVQDDDKLMRLVCKEALKIGALKFDF